MAGSVAVLNKRNEARTERGPGGPLPAAAPGGQPWEPSAILGAGFLIFVALMVAGAFISTLLTALYMMH